MGKYHTGVFYGPADPAKFGDGLRGMFQSLRTDIGSFASDNLITFERNLSFLTDEAFMAAFRRHATTVVEHAVIWRVATVAWGARNAMRLSGDLVECACYKGVTANIVSDYVRLAEHPERKYYLYDLFEHDASMPHHTLPEHGASLFQQVKQRFADLPNVVVTQGRVPDSFAQAIPEKIAFLHLDLNNAQAELGALEVLFERMVPGAVMILDDYGWLAYRQQKMAEDPWFAARGYQVLELPTGQGMLVK